jgi:solute carrier family 25 citrate transporter 1
LRGFYAGCSTLVVSNAVKASVRFLSLSAAHSYNGKHLKRAGVGSTGINVAAGLSAGVAESIIVVTPGECIKTRMIQQAGNRAGLERLTPITALRDMIRHEGILAPWKGLGPVLLKQGTNSAVRFSTFESLKNQVATRWPGQEQSVAMNLALGGISGIVTVCVSSTNPSLVTFLTLSSS